MSAIARYLNNMGKYVFGYDRVKSNLCTELENEGIKISYIDEIESSFSSKFTRQNTLIIYTPAIPSNSKILNYLNNNDYQVLKRSQILGLITQNSQNISVAGTHGKTTTSTLIAHLLTFAQKPCAAFLGGISVNLKSNYFNSNTKDNFPLTVTEADEYDRSFLTLNPDIAVVTSMDADHLDIYGTALELEKSFFEFIKKIKKGGSLIINHKLKTINAKGIKIETYGIETGTFQARNIGIEKSKFVFDYFENNKFWSKIELGIPGIHNVENAVAAIAVCTKIGLEKAKIIEGLKKFKGVKRRFEYILNDENCIFIDDYAHHPTEIESLIKSVKLLYNGKEITGIFQPHLYSRTRDFANEFATSLSLLNTCILLDIYPARELPIEGVNSEIIYKNLKSPKKFLCKNENIGTLLKEIKPQVLLTIGAGDIDTFIPQIKKTLENG